MTTRQQELERATQARQILENPIWVEAVETIERDIRTGWETAQDTDTREAMWHRLQAFTALQAMIRAVFKTGTIERGAEHVR